MNDSKVISRIDNALSRVKLLKKFLPHDGICDVGCGDGSFLLALRQNGYYDCWGIEPSLFSSKIASERNLDIVNGNISEISELKSGRKINTITLFHVIEHLSNPFEVLNSIRNILDVGGILIIETPDSEAAIQKITNHNNSLIYDEHLFYWNKKSLYFILEQIGFKVLSFSRRSYDWKNSPIKTSLTRLGLSPKYKVTSQSIVHSCNDQNPFYSSRKSPKSVFSIKYLIQKMIRKFLAYLVHILKRDDYIILVAVRI